MNMHTWRTAPAIIALFLVGSMTGAAPPPQEVVVTSADPDSALQGTVDLDVEITGDGFDNSAEVRFLVTGTEDPGGIDVTNVRVRGHRSITATINVEDTAVVDDFDIEVELRSSGRGGKGTTLFRVHENTALPNRIAGCVTFAPGLPIGSDNGSPYCDGDAYAEDHIGEPGNMQVAMRCQFNHFNLTPGGGSRHIFLDLNAAPIQTEISACEDTNGVIDVEFRDTTMTNVPNCTNTIDPDWGFDDVMRSSPSEVNICALGLNESTDANLRFQANLHYRRDNRDPPCKGGNNRCGRYREWIIVRFNDELLCPPVRITCTGMGPNGLCSSWTVVSNHNACVTNESGNDQSIVYLPFIANFIACQNNDCTNR